MKKIIIVFLVFSFTFSFAQQQIEGYGGWKWGTLLTDVESELVKSKNKMPGFASYEKKNEKNTYEGLQARIISYGFKKGKLEALNVGLYNKDLDKILGIFKKKYGEPKVTETPFFTNYEWHLDSADMSITYFPSKEEEGVTIGIRGKLK